MKTQPAQSHLATLDGLRGLAALAVFAGHLIGEMHLRSALTNEPLETVIPHVHLAVDFFFMLSGFVVARAYERKLLTKLSTTQFLSLRLIRLYPLIFIGITLGTMALAIRVVLTHSPSFPKLFVAAVSALLLLPTSALLSVYPGELFPIDFPQWSLLFELIVNLFYALIIPWLSTVRLVVLCAVSFVGLCVTAAASNRLLDVGMSLQPVGIIPADIWCGVIRVSFPFFFGVLLFRLFHAENTYKDRVGDAGSILLCIGLMVILFLPGYRHSWIYEVSAEAFIFPMILVFSIKSKTSPSLNKAFLVLGELSYPLYITHNPVTRIVINVLHLLHVKLPAALVFSLSLCVAVVAAWFLLELVDRPVRKWLSSWNRGKRRDHYAALATSSLR